MFKASKIATIILASLLIISCGREQVTGSGAAKADNREVTAFTSLVVNGAYQINGNNSEKPTLTITSNENLLPFIVSSVQRGTLTIANKKNVDLFPTTQQIITFSTQNFDSLTLNGSSNFTFDNLKTKTLTMNLSGSNQVKISGQGGKLNIAVNGSGEVDTRNFKVADSTIEINGDATVYVNATKNLDVTINGNGKIISLGGTPKIRQNIHGSGQITSEFGNPRN